MDCVLGLCCQGLLKIGQEIEPVGRPRCTHWGRWWWSRVACRPGWTGQGQRATFVAGLSIVRWTQNIPILCEFVDGNTISKFQTPPCCWSVPSAGTTDEVSLVACWELTPPMVCNRFTPKLEFTPMLGCCRLIDNGLSDPAGWGRGGRGWMVASFPETISSKQFLISRLAKRQVALSGAFKILALAKGVGDISWWLLPWAGGTGCRTTSLFSPRRSSSSSLFFTFLASSSSSSFLLTTDPLLSSSSSSLGRFLPSCSRGWPDSGTRYELEKSKPWFQKSISHWAGILQTRKEKGISFG